MRYFIFNYTKDVNFIESFLQSKAFATNTVPKTKEWFLWKFRDNPFGETVLACVEEDGSIVGCVAYGLQDFLLLNNVIKGAISFENFVHPEFQRRGIFSKLISLGEKEIQMQGVSFLLNFPNSNSLNGFLKMKWIKLNISEYWIKVRSLIPVFTHYKDLKKTFQSGSPNMNSLVLPQNFSQGKFNNFYMIINYEYLKWRFTSFPNGKYFCISNKDYDMIGRLGIRGKIREFQILYINKKTISFQFSKLCRDLKENIDLDIIGISSSPSNGEKLHFLRNGFFKVPNKTNVCFKILDDSVVKESDMNQLSLQGINYHTY